MARRAARRRPKPGEVMGEALWKCSECYTNSTQSALLTIHHPFAWQFVQRRYDMISGCPICGGIHLDPAPVKRVK